MMIFVIVFPILAGWLGGWLINYLADTLPLTHRLTRPTCKQCGREYSAGVYLSFRPCRNCGHRRGLRPWFVQAAMMAIGLYTWFNPHRMGYALGMVLITYYAVVVVIDMEHRLILHPTSIAGALLGLGLGTWLHGLLPTLEGGLGGLVIMLVLYYFGMLFAKLRAKRMQESGQESDDEEALGAGDVILAGVLGLILGWPVIWFGLLLGILLGGIAGILLILYLMAAKKYGKEALMVFMPYGPFFIASAFFIMFVPNWIIAVIPK
ncbi:MAG: prepilin peptidase [Chloroflexi bacterium]|nr:prepilin peptidase [Chloroflexota bacterium]MBI3339272.1 prepilin peptidase [Chloroflexota bacterium]